MTVTLYAKPEGTCVPCTATEKALIKNGIEYTRIDITKDEAAFDLIVGLGYQAAPVVIAGEDHWSGYRPEKITALAA